MNINPQTVTAWPTQVNPNQITIVDSKKINWSNKLQLIFLEVT